MKKILAFFSLIFCILFCAGCAQCTYTVEYKQNGEITQTFTTTVNTATLQEQGFSYADFLTTLNNIYSNYVTNKQTSMRENLNKNTQLSTQQANEIYASVTCEITALENGLNLVITYPSSYIANIVNTDPSQQESTNNNTYVHTWFTTTMVQDVTNIYNGYNETELYNQLHSYYCQNNKFTDQDLALKQVMVFSTSRYKSNAKQIIKNNNMYYHIWDINTQKDSAGNVASTKLELYYTYAKPLAWYVLATVITAIFMVVASIVIIQQKKTKN